MEDYTKIRNEMILKDLLPKPIIGKGLLNTAIDNLPFPLHLPGYNYAGPGTPLDLYIEKGIKPVNKLDEAAKAHDIAYSNTHDLKKRHEADHILQEEAWKRVKAEDSGLGEKTSAWLVTNAMKAKRMLGAGLNNTMYLKHAVNLDENDTKRLQNALITLKPLKVKLGYNRTKFSVQNETFLPLTAIQIKKLNAAHKKQQDCILLISQNQLKSMGKEGGFLPMAAIAAAPAVVSVISSLVKAWSDKKTNDKLVEERIRHNKTLEELAKAGKGLKIKKSKPGKGIYINKKPVIGNGLYNELLKKKKSL